MNSEYFYDLIKVSSCASIYDCEEPMPSFLQAEIRKLAGMSVKNLYVIGGCNGAGKTTAAKTLLPDVVSCDEFVNADEIARGLSPFKPESVAIEAGRLMTTRITQLLNIGRSFAFETTLSGTSHIHRISEAKKSGYAVTLLFFWLQSPELASERVRIRVQEGGHGLARDIIDRRYRKGIQNLFRYYLPVVDSAFLIDNSEGNFELIAQKMITGNSEIYNLSTFERLNKCAYDS